MTTNQVRTSLAPHVIAAEKRGCKGKASEATRQCRRDAWHCELVACTTHVGDAQIAGDTLTSGLIHRPRPDPQPRHSTLSTRSEQPIFPGRNWGGAMPGDWRRGSYLANFVPSCLFSSMRPGTLKKRFVFTLLHSHVPKEHSYAHDMYVLMPGIWSIYSKN